MKLNDQSTWWNATETVEINDEKLGKIKVRKWSQLHFLNSSSVNMTLILVERLETHKKGSLQIMNKHKFGALHFVNAPYKSGDRTNFCISEQLYAEVLETAGE